MKNDRRSWQIKSSEEKSQDKTKAFNRVVRLLHRRDHSIKELRTKLNPYYEAETIEAAIERAQEYKYIKPAEELAQQFARSLHKKHKGHQKICYELQKKGLPEVAMDRDVELEKARSLLEKLLPPSEDDIKSAGDKLKQKAYRHLQNKGFDFDTIRQAIDEKF